MEDKMIFADCSYCDRRFKLADEDMNASGVSCPACGKLLNIIFESKEEDSTSVIYKSKLFSDKGNHISKTAPVNEIHTPSIAEDETHVVNMNPEYKVDVFIPTIAGCGAEDKGWDQERCLQYQKFLNKYANLGWRLHTAEYREVKVAGGCGNTQGAWLVCVFEKMP